MIAIGLVLVLVGFIVKVSAMWVAGFILAGIGLLLLAVGLTGHPIGGRRHWY